ncbi:gp41 [Sphingomonas phage PAU]|uniref:DNA topoisomerase II n=1 Tax=Sphingomonas phage PAU TaxID=1150991 RepID=UPI000257312E|nr:DNA topoisomerase II [Sphingomonas phage PAU]AFF28039.1 gp41 [Sphingomonas phage PAU]
MAKLSNEEILDKYRMKDEIEHILTRSEMFVGSKAPETKVTNIINSEDKVESQKITYIPAVLKVIDEVLSNSVDEYRRNIAGTSNSGVTKIDIEIRRNGHITIQDNGGIPTDIHPLTGQPIPAFLFSNLRTSTNYDDTKSRNVTGTNGVGAVLTNIFSNRFTVKTSLNPKGQTYIKTWENNLSVTKDDVFEKSKGFKGSIFDFEIDMSRFSLDENQEEIINDEVLSLFKRRCIDAAGANPGLTISLKIEDYERTWKFNSFKDYISTFSGIDASKLIGEKNDQWEIYYYPNADKEAYEIGFVNGAECNIGRHFEVGVVEAVEALGRLLKRNKLTCDYRQFVNHCHVFINMNVPNPVYSNQTKEKLSTKADKLTEKGRPALSQGLKRLLCESEIIQLLLDWHEQSKKAGERKKLRDLANEQAKKVKVAKLVDANAKTNRNECELWVFEGESASSGFRNARNPETQAKYDLKGKVMNTFGMSRLQIFQRNVEYRDMVTAINLPIDNSKIDFESLRYGKIIITTDMDVDGDSIAAQLISFYYHNYRELLEAGMIYRAIAPIISAEKDGEVKLFYSVKEFNDSGLRGWSVRYLKGTGSMTSDEYTEMIQNSHLQQLKIDGETGRVLEDWFSNDISRRKKYFEDELA